MNTAGLSWLERTANKLAHGQTKKVPAEEWLIERDFLQPFEPVIVEPLPPLLYAVRKDNTISFKSNLYSLPLGTYVGRGTQVAVCSEEGILIIYKTNQAELCRHTISPESGVKIINTDHRRDKSKTLEDMVEGLCDRAAAPDNMRQFIFGIRTDKPRYLRDQLIIIREALNGAQEQDIQEALRFCLDQGITSANDFKTLLKNLKEVEPGATEICSLNPLNGTYPAEALLQPQLSRIEDYQLLLNPQPN